MGFCLKSFTVNNYSPLQALYRQILFSILRYSSKKIHGLKLYHLLNFTLHSKGNACNIGSFIRFYMQMRVEGIYFRMQSEIQQMVKLQTINFIRNAGRKKKTKYLPIECLQGTIIIYSASWEISSISDIRFYLLAKHL